MSYFKKAFPNANVTRTKTCVYGEYRGFHMCVSYDKSTKQMLATVKYTGGEAGVRGRLMVGINTEIKRQNRLFVASVGEHTASMRSQSMSKSKLAENAEWAVNTLVMTLIAEGCVTGCEKCGATTEISDIYINGVAKTLCGNCSLDVASRVMSGKVKLMPQESELLPGMLGAFGGALVGGIIFALVMQTGFSISILGALTSFLALIGYEKMGKDIDKKGVAVSWIVSIIVMLAANYFGLSMFLSGKFQEEGINFTFSYVATNLIDLIRDTGMTMPFAKVVIKSTLFTVFGVLPRLKDDLNI